MTVRPILFSAPMVRALLAGRKTMTRRVFKPQPVERADGLFDCHGREGGIFAADAATVADWMRDVAPFAPGDMLWVREALDLFPGHAEYVADDARVGADSIEAMRWLDRYSRAKAPGIHMPRWASRLTLAVTDVRVERLQAISAADAVAEGLVRLKATGRYVVAPGDQYLGAAAHDPRTVYCWLWDGIHGPGSWTANPWVVALSFEVIAENVDRVLERRAA